MQNKHLELTVRIEGEYDERSAKELKKELATVGVDLSIAGNIMSIALFNGERGDSLDFYVKRARNAGRNPVCASYEDRLLTVRDIVQMHTIENKKWSDIQEMIGMSHGTFFRHKETVDKMLREHVGVSVNECKISDLDIAPKYIAEHIF